MHCQGNPSDLFSDFENFEAFEKKKMPKLTVFKNVKNSRICFSFVLSHAIIFYIMHFDAP